MIYSIRFDTFDMLAMHRRTHTPTQYMYTRNHFKPSSFDENSYLYLHLFHHRRRRRHRHAVFVVNSSFLSFFLLFIHPFLISVFAILTDNFRIILNNVAVRQISHHANDDIQHNYYHHFQLFQ